MMRYLKYAPVILLIVLLAVACGKSPGAPSSAGDSTSNGSDRMHGYDLPQLPDRVYYTLNPKVPLQGPVLSTDSDQYVTDVFRLLLREADALARDYRASGDERAYWAFLVGALTVPYHESGLQHFRQLNLLGGHCISSVNSGAELQKKGAHYFVPFQKYMHSGDTPPIPDCDELSRGESATQLVASDDHVSAGMMQINLFWNKDDYVAPGKYLSVADTVNFGLNQFARGFQQIYRTAANYPCLLDGRASGDPVNYTALIRGAWAGAYNSGNVSQTCRFANSSSKYHANDELFRRHLEDQVLGSPNVYLKHLTGLELQAFQDIVANFLNRGDARSATDQVLAMHASASVESTPLDTGTIVPAFVNVRQGPSRGKILAVKLRGQTVQIIAEKKLSADAKYPWYQIQSDHGWIYGADLKVTKP